MQAVFEKIIEKLEEKQDIFLYDDSDYGEGKYNAFDEAIEIVKQEAEKYNKDNYFNLDHTTLHKCPKCGADAEHRVNRKGLWACGCFKCNLFKTAYDHGKAIESWEDFCAEYNNGWIPCNEKLPELRKDVLVTVKYTGFMGMHGYWIKTGHMEAENDWWGDCAGGDVIAWQPLPEPYKTKGE